MLSSSYGKNLWIQDELGGFAPVQSHKDIQDRPRGKGEPDWWVVAKDKSWTPPEPRSLLSLGATSESPGADGSGGSGGGMKIGAGHKPQPYGWHGYYGATGGGSISGGHEVRGPVTPPSGKGKAIPPPPAPREPHLTYSIKNGTLRDARGGLMTDKGYSGLGEAKNKPGQQHVEDRGPIPEGNWRVKEITDPNYRPDLTRPIYRLDPDEVTRKRVEAMDRKPDTFLIHGDNTTHTASTGCIIVDRNTREQLRSHAGGWIHVRQ